MLGGLFCLRGPAHEEKLREARVADAGAVPDGGDEGTRDAFVLVNIAATSRTGRRSPCAASWTFERSPRDGMVPASTWTRLSRPP
jgi:hypothetical protein